MRTKAPRTCIACVIFTCGRCTIGSEMIDFNFISVCFLILLLWFSIRSVFSRTRGKVYPPGPWGLPIVGHLVLLGKFPEETFMRWRSKYGDVFRIRMGSRDTVVLNGYNVVSAAAELKDDVFSDRLNLVSTNLVKEAGGGVHALSTLPFNEIFLQCRKVITTAIRSASRSKSNPSADTVRIAAAAFCDTVLSHGKSGPVLVGDALRKTIGVVGYKTLFGGHSDNSHTEKQVKRLIEHLNAAIVLFLEIGSSAVDFMPWMKCLISSKLTKLAKEIEKLTNVVEEEINDHKKIFAKGTVRDITDRIIDYQKEHTHDLDLVSMHLQSSLKELFYAGFETSAVTIEWLFLYMIAFPEVQENIQKEIDDIVGTGRLVTVGDRNDLHYTMAVINEVMRMRNILPFAMPHQALLDTDFMGFHIEKGTFILFNLHSVNHDESVWDDPFKFRPERLLDENGRLDKYKCKRIVPFSMGRRRCAGEPLAKMQIFTIFATVLQRCSLTRPKNETIDLTPIPKQIYSPKEFRMLVKERYDVKH